MAHYVLFVSGSYNIATSSHGVTFSAVTVFLKQQPEVISELQINPNQSGYESDFIRGPSCLCQKIFY